VRAFLWLDGLLVAASVACQRAPSPEQALPAPRVLRAGEHVCQGELCRQAHPRLPDTGEWRCAEAEKVVWCAGGEPAAGVTPGAADPQFRCGARWGARAAKGERVCVDAVPDYPDGARDDYDCSYEQERGVTRVCRKQRRAARALAHGGALPACFFDEDCPSGSCDRGACRCAGNHDCKSGSCASGVCVGATP